MAIADCGSESLAAQWLGLTQPAVHAALQGLETSLGMQLFYKLAFGTRLTPSGEALLRRVKLALAEVRGMDSDISAWRGEIRGAWWSACCRCRWESSCRARSTAWPPATRTSRSASWTAPTRVWCSTC